MSDPIKLRAGRLDAHFTEAAAGDGLGMASRKVRCRLAEGSGSGLTDEMLCLLRVRLRLAILIILSAFVLHFLRNVLLPGSALDQRPLWLTVSGCEIVVMA